MIAVSWYQLYICQHTNMIGDCNQALTRLYMENISEDQSTTGGSLWRSHLIWNVNVYSHKTASKKSRLKIPCPHKPLRWEVSDQ